MHFDEAQSMHSALKVRVIKNSLSKVVTWAVLVKKSFHVVCISLLDSVRDYEALQVMLHQNIDWVS